LERKEWKEEQDREGKERREGSEERACLKKSIE